jgi:hypothetical protein
VGDFPALLRMFQAMLPNKFGKRKRYQKYKNISIVFSLICIENMYRFDFILLYHRKLNQLDINDSLNKP